MAVLLAAALATASPHPMRLFEGYKEGMRGNLVHLLARLPISPLGLRLGLGLGLDSDRGCRTGGHAEACGCCLLMLPHEWGSELTRVIGLCWLDSPSIAALSESSKQKVCVIDRK